MSNIKTVETLGSESIRWNLNDLFLGPQDPRIEQTLLKAADQVRDFATRYRGKVGTLSPEALKVALDEKEAMIGHTYPLSQYVHLLFSTDLANNQVKSLVARVDEKLTEMGNELIFFDLELGKLSASQYQKLSSAPCLADFAYTLSQIHQKSKYKLSELEEQMVRLKDLTGVDAHQRLYAEYSSSFQFEMEINGELRTMNGSELRALRQDPDPKVRERAMKLFLGRYQDNQLIFTHILNSVVKDYAIEIQKRGYESAIQCKNIGNDLPDEVIDVLHDITTASYPLVHRYYQLKSKMLGMDKLTLSDIYAPLPKAKKKYHWDEAVSMVLDSFKAFDADFYRYAKQIFDDQKIDAPVTANKRGGAYCSSSIPGLSPYVFLNFLGRPRDISTMAHELGHAIHAFLSSQQRIWNYHAILPLCETASVFSEMILVDDMKKKETDKAALISLLSETLEDTFATSHRQNMFSCFERRIHSAVKEGLMSGDEFSAIYKEELQKMFGDAVEIPDHYHWEWATIPHIIDVPFYVYSYNFGNLLVMALYAQYKEEGAAFIPRLKQFLSAGSSDSPEKLLQDLGFSLSDPKFWQRSIDLIEGMIDELELLVA